MITIYNPHPTEPMLVDTNGVAPPIHLKESFFLATMGNAPMLSLSAGSDNGLGEFNFYQAARLKQAINFSDVNALNKRLNMLAVEHFTGIPGDYKDFIVHKGILPAGALILRSFNGVAGGEWFGLTHEQANYQGLQRLEARIDGGRIVAVNPSAMFAANNDASLQRLLMAQWNDSAQKRAHMADIDAQLEMKLITEKQSIPELGTLRTFLRAEYKGKPWWPETAIA